MDLEIDMGKYVQSMEEMQVKLSEIRDNIEKLEEELWLLGDVAQRARESLESAADALSELV